MPFTSSRVTHRTTVAVAVPSAPKCRFRELTWGAINPHYIEDVYGKFAVCPCSYSFRTPRRNRQLPRQPRQHLHSDSAFLVPVQPPGLFDPFHRLCARGWGHDNAWINRPARRGRGGEVITTVVPSNTGRAACATTFISAWSVQSYLRGRAWRSSSVSSTPRGETIIPDDLRDKVLIQCYGPDLRTAVLDLPLAASASGMNRLRLVDVHRPTSMRTPLRA